MVKIAKNADQKNAEPRVNGQIRGDECRLIDENGNNVGIVSVKEALDMADEAGLDLVEIAGNQTPPVCSIMNYGKYKYDKAKKDKEAKKNARGKQLKEMKFRCRIGDGDYETKKNHIIRFIEDGNNVKITIMFRGREMSHSDLGLAILDRLAKDLEGKVNIVSAPKMEGRNMHMTVSPISAKSK